MKRRTFLKGLGLAVAGTAMSPELGAKTLGSAAGLTADPFAPDPFNPEFHGKGDLNGIKCGIRSLEPKVDRQITVAVIGAGSRGNVYGNYFLKYPKAVKVVAVSDINPVRREIYSKKHNIPADRQYGDFHEILAAGKLADAVLICTPDDLHYEPCMKALELGYDVLLEKPCAQTEKECRDILAQSKKYGRIVAVCHVLRYSPYFMAMRQVMQSGMIGKPVSIQHMEPIQYAHMSHSYVRGNWRNSKETTPIILAKSCHDLDILRWMFGQPCKSVSAYGSLDFFKSENAPKDAPLRCTDGCPHDGECPYSALEIYMRRKEYLYVFDNLDKKSESDIFKHLVDTGYGRCVFHCDNDQPDHYVANMEFDGGLTAAFSMEAFALQGGRRTRVMGTLGMIDGDGKQFTVNNFLKREQHVWNLDLDDIPEYRGSGHGGGDNALARDFVEAVAAHDPSKLTSTIDASIESHVMGFACEKSRLSSRKVNIKL